MSNYIVTKIDTDFTPETHNVGSSSAQSSAIITGSGLIRIATTTHAHIKFGANPTATEEDLMLPSDHVEIFAFKSGEKVAFIHHQGGSGEINICAVD
jgi:purine nucleoside phosphorylase